MNKLVQKQIELLKEKLKANIRECKSQHRYRDLILEICDICHAEDLKDECPLKQFVMELAAEDIISKYKANTFKHN